MLQLQRQLERLEERRNKITEGKKFSAQHIAEWREHPITQVLMLDLQEMQIESVIELMKDEWTEPYRESLVQFCTALESVLEWTPPEVEDEQS